MSRRVRSASAPNTRSAHASSDVDRSADLQPFGCRLGGSGRAAQAAPGRGRRDHVHRRPRSYALGMRSPGRTAAARRRLSSCLLGVTVAAACGSSSSSSTTTTTAAAQDAAVRAAVAARRLGGPDGRGRGRVAVPAGPPARPVRDGPHGHGPCRHRVRRRSSTPRWRPTHPSTASTSTRRSAPSPGSPPTSTSTRPRRPWPAPGLPVLAGLQASRRRCTGRSRCTGLTAGARTPRPPRSRRTPGSRRPGRTTWPMTTTAGA